MEEEQKVVLVCLGSRNHEVSFHNTSQFQSGCSSYSALKEAVCDVFKDVLNPRSGLILQVLSIDYSL